MRKRLVSPSWAIFVSLISQPKLSMFECGTEQRSDLNDNFWLDSVTARAYLARTGVVYHIHFRAGLLTFQINSLKRSWVSKTFVRRKNRLLNLARKENVKEKLAKSWKRAPVNKQRLLYLHTKNVKPNFSFRWLCPCDNKCSPTIKLYLESFLICLSFRSIHVLFS